ncbi:MAG: acetate--CoA ligase family protein [archaeon]
MKALEQKEINELLIKYKIPLPIHEIVKTENEIYKAAKKIKYPVVLKIISNSISHKSDVGGVKINIKDEKELKEAYKDITNSVPNSKIDLFLVQKHYEGHYVIIGMKQDKQFGPVLMFGLGGVFVEILNDVSFRIAPVTQKDAKEMIKEIKSYKILEGARGTKKANIKILTQILIKISKLSLENEEIKELDLNPIVINDLEAVTVDVRMFR